MWCNVPYRLAVLALHPSGPSLAVRQLRGARQLCGCKTPVPSSDGVPCVGKGSLQPAAASPARGARKERPGSPGLAADGRSAGAHPSWPLSPLCNSARCPSPPSPERAVSGAVASICPLQSGASGPTPCPPSPSSCGISCLKHFLDSRGGFCSLSPLFSIAAWSPA